MSNLIPLHFDRFDVRMIMRDGVPWWVLADVAPLLDLANPSKLAGRLEDYQKDTIPSRDSVGRRRNLIVVNEAGIYALTLNSKKPQAKQFAHWLFTQVLPSIRQHGCYPPPAVDEQALFEGYQALDGSTPPARFMEECARIAEERGAESAFAVARWFMTDGKANAMLRGDGNVRNLVTDYDTLRGLVAYEMDLQYVFTGVRSLGHTRHERQLLLGTRAATEEQRLLTER